MRFSGHTHLFPQVKGKGEKFRGLKTWQQQESNLSAAVAAPFYQSFVGANINKQ